MITKVECSGCGGIGRHDNTCPYVPRTAEPTARMSAELKAKCEVCGAKRGEPCVNTLHPGQPLPGRAFHIGRIERTTAKEKK